MKSLRILGIGAAALALFACATAGKNAEAVSGPEPSKQEESRTAGKDTTPEVIRSLAANVERRLIENTRLAVVNVSSESAVFSDYVIEELIAALEESGKLNIVDRNALHLALVQSEMDFQLSGEVSDETQQALGKMLGAQSLLSASLVDMGDSYRLRLAVIAVESLAREATSASDLPKSERVEYMMKTTEPVTRKRVDNPVTASDYKRRGNEYMSGTREYDLAIADFTEAIKLKPLDADAYVMRAEAYRWKDDHRTAIEDYNEALRLVPGYTLAYVWRGWSYVEIDDYEKAEQDLARALQLDPNNGLVYNHLGVVRYHNKDYRGALEAYTKSIAICGKLTSHWFIYSNRAAAYIKLGDRKRCIQDLEQAFSLNPEGELVRERIEALKQNMWIE